jgi:hypothetical protein
MTEGAKQHRQRTILRWAVTGIVLAALAALVVYLVVTTHAQ